MATVSIYKNMLAAYGIDSSRFSFGVDAGVGAVVSGFEMGHGYSNDPYSAAKGTGDTGASIGYFYGSWDTIPDTDEFDAFYLKFGIAKNCDLIDMQTADPDIGSWADADMLSVIGPAVSGPVTSGIVVDNPSEPSWTLCEMAAADSLRVKYRLLFRKESGFISLGSCSVHNLLLLNKLDLPEAARTQVEAQYTYGSAKSYTLGGKAQYSSYGADIRSEIQVNYELIREDEKDLLIDLYQTCRGSTYPFVLRLDDEAFPVLFIADLNVIEEQAGLYNITLSLESL